MRRAGRSGRVLAEQRAGSELAELRASAFPDSGDAEEEEAVPV